MLPKVFAVFHKETETFKLLQPEVNEKGSIIRLKPWYNNSEKGQEWFVVPTYNQGSIYSPESHRVVIHDNIYVFWSLRHSLIWSDYLVYASRRDESKIEWMNSLKIPIIEFNSKLIYPRTETNFYARWNSTPPNLIYELEKGLQEYKKNMEAGFVNTSIQYSMNEDTINLSDLRIRTPVPKNNDSDDDSNGCVTACYTPKKRSLSDVTNEVNIAAVKDFNPKTICHLLCLAFGGGVMFYSCLRSYLPV